MRSGITHRWLRGSLFLTVLLVLLVESMFVYNFSRSYYNSVQQTMMRRFSSINGQLKMPPVMTVLLCTPLLISPFLFQFFIHQAVIVIAAFADLSLCHCVFYAAYFFSYVDTA